MDLTRWDKKFLIKVVGDLAYYFLSLIATVKKVILNSNKIIDNTKNLLKSHVFMLQKNYWKSLIYIKSFKITAWQYKRWLVLV